MKKTNFLKILSLILCLALFAAGCGAGQTNEPAAAIVTDGQTVGEGSLSFPLEIVDKDGNEISVTVNTDEETVGAALLELGIVEGEDGPYGLYITRVNGITAIYEEDGTYWAFYVNDEYATAGVDTTPITGGETYALKVEK